MTIQSIDSMKLNHATNFPGCESIDDFTDIIRFSHLPHSLSSISFNTEKAEFTEFVLSHRVPQIAFCNF